MVRFWLLTALVAGALGDQKQEPSRQKIEGNYGLGNYGLGDYGLGEYGLVELGRGELGRDKLGSGELGRGELGRGELGRGEYGRGELGLGELGLREIGLGELGRGEYGRGELGRGEYDPNERCCGDRGEYGYNRNLKRILEDHALVPWVEPLKGVRSHAPAPIVAIQNKIVRETYSPDYYQPVKVIDYRYLKTGREYTRGRGGQVIILPAGIKDPRYGSYDALIESLKQQRLREREGRYLHERRPPYGRYGEEEIEGYGEHIPVYGEGQERLIKESVRARRPELIDEPVLRRPLVPKQNVNYRDVGK